jgi:protease II
VTLRARWVTLRARWVTLRARWVTPRACWCDAKSSLGDANGIFVQVVLDENATAAGHDYCHVGTVAPSPSHQLLAYCVDTTGYETYRTVFVDLVSGDQVEGEAGIAEMDALVWGVDDSEVFYTKQDHAHRPFQLWRHTLGTEPASDELLFTESDEKFWVSEYEGLALVSDGLLSFGFHASAGGPSGSPVLAAVGLVSSIVTQRRGCHPR